MAHKLWSECSVTLKSLISVDPLTMYLGVDAL